MVDAVVTSDAPLRVSHTEVRPGLVPDLPNRIKASDQNNRRIKKRMKKIDTG